MDNVEFITYQFLGIDYIDKQKTCMPLIFSTPRIPLIFLISALLCFAGCQSNDPTTNKSFTITVQDGYLGIGERFFVIVSDGSGKVIKSNELPRSGVWTVDGTPGTITLTFIIYGEDATDVYRSVSTYANQPVKDLTFTAQATPSITAYDSTVVTVDGVPGNVDVVGSGNTWWGNMGTYPANSGNLTMTVPEKGAFGLTLTDANMNSYFRIFQKAELKDSLSVPFDEFEPLSSTELSVPNATWHIDTGIIDSLTSTNFVYSTTTNFDGIAAVYSKEPAKPLFSRYASFTGTQSATEYSSYQTRGLHPHHVVKSLAAKKQYFEQVNRQLKGGFSADFDDFFLLNYVGKQIGGKRYHDDRFLRAPGGRNIVINLPEIPTEILSQVFPEGYTEIAYRFMTILDNTSSAEFESEVLSRQYDLLPTNARVGVVNPTDFINQMAEIRKRTNSIQY